MATSCILSALNDTLTALRAIPFVWADVPGAAKSQPTKLFQKVAVWNNQAARMENGKGVMYEMPACFVEMRPQPAQQVLDNVTLTDICWRLHILHGQVDAGNDTDMDQNLVVYEVRDLTKATMVGFQPSNCSTMFCDGEEQDYEHGTMYHYMLDMKTVLRDTKGSILDPDQTKVIYKTPPTNLELETGFTEGDVPPVDPIVSYIWKACEVRAQIVDTPDPEITQLLGNGVTIPLQYMLQDNGTLYIPYLNSTPGITILASFLVNGQETTTVQWAYDTELEGYVLDNSSGGGFAVDDNLQFDASLPLGVGS